MKPPPFFGVGAHRGDRETRTFRWLGVGVALLMCTGALRPAEGQIPQEGEVRQIVSLSFTPGSAAEATRLFHQLAVPLYESDPEMVSFRGFSEVESSIPLDLVVVSAFEGMAGMDASNDFLRGAGIGEFYGQVGPLLASHTDQFVEMLPELGRGDPSGAPRTALIWYRIIPGAGAGFERALAATAVPHEEATGVSSQTGRFLLSDGWHYLRFVGLSSLGGYQSYLTGLSEAQGYQELAEYVVATREVILRPVPDLFVRP